MGCAGNECNVTGEGNKINSIDLFITEKCNMNCSYCFHPKKDNTLSVEQGKAILDKMKIIAPRDIQISFFGGEPLLYPGTVVELAKYARQLWPDKEEIVNGQPVDMHYSTFSITTNGTIFDEALFEDLKKLKFSVMLSVDGDAATTMEYRKGDHKLVIENCKKIIASGIDASVRMTFTPKVVGRLAINVKYLHQEVGFIKIMHHAVMEADWTPESVEIYQYQLTQLYHYRRWCKKKDIPLFLAFIDKPLAIVNDEQVPEYEFCQAGKSYFAVLPDGDVYPCHRAASNRIDKLGNLFNTKRPIVQGMYLAINKESVGCWKNCSAARTCHCCIIAQRQINGRIGEPLVKYCELCKVENNIAKGFLPIELGDRHEKMLSNIGSMQLRMGNALCQLSDKVDKLFNKEIK